MTPLFELEPGWARRCWWQTLSMLKRVWIYEFILAVVTLAVYCAIAQLPSALQCIGNIVAFAGIYLRMAIYAADDKAQQDIGSIKNILTSLSNREIIVSSMWFLIFNVILNIAISNTAVLANANLLAIFSWPQLSAEQTLFRAVEILLYQTSTAIIYVNIYHACRFLLDLSKIETLKEYLNCHWGLLFAIACRAVFGRTIVLSAAIGHLWIVGLTFVTILLSKWYIPLFYLFVPCYLFCFTRELFTGRTTSREPESQTVGNLAPVAV